jgi:hypothetical protein
MGLSGVELTPFIGANNLLGVGYYSGLVEAMLESFTN